MGYKSIFAPIIFEDTTPPVMDAALALAGRFHGHVHAKHIRQEYSYYPPMIYYPMAVEMPAAVQEQQDEAATKLAHSLKAMVTDACDSSAARIVPLNEAPYQNGVTVSWQDERGSLPSDYGRSARVADLTVICLPDKKGNGLETSIFENLLMSSAHPVLLVPREGLAGMPARALIAWDGSQPVARAVDAAMPLLETADDVFVVTIGEEDFGTPTVEDVVAYLARHGVEAEASRVDWPKKPVAERILNQAEAHNCDLIVMGGYSHARMYESVLGGVTHDMLKHADRAVFMAH